MTKSLFVRASVSGIRHRQFRQGLLGATASSGAFALLIAANPQSALAANCTVTAAPNVVTCGTGSGTVVTTDDTTNTDAGSNPSHKREYKFTTGGDINASVLSGITVNGFGLAITSTPANGAANISFTNGGTIQLTAGVPNGSHGGSDALDLNGNGGNVSYVGSGGTVSTGTPSNVTNGLVLSTTGFGTANVGSSGSPVTGGTFFGENAIVTSTVGGNAGVYLSGGTVTATGTSSDAIYGSNTTGGDFNVTLTGNTNIVNGSGGVNGTFGIGVADGAAGASNPFGPGNVNIVTNADIGNTGLGPVFADGIAIGITAGITGNINVEQTAGGIINYQNYGINAQTAGTVATGGNGNINITIDANSTLAETGSTGTGINAVANGATGAVTVTVNGKIDPPDVGVNATITNAANSSAVNVPVGASGSITANDIGIIASTVGTGSVTVTTAAGSVVNQGVSGGLENTKVPTPLGAIVTSATSGTTTVDAEGAVTANSYGINSSASNGGSIGVTTGASAIRGDANSNASGSGIFASTIGGNGSVTIVTGAGQVSGSIFQGAAVEGHAVGTGAVNVTIGSGGVAITGADEASDAVQTTAASGATKIITNGFVDAGLGDNVGNGISASATAGGAITINANDSVVGYVNGIVTNAVGGGNTLITTAAGTTVASSELGTIGGSVGAGDGIHATSDTGSITGVINSAVTGDPGIYMATMGGNINLMTGGGAITGSTGIQLDTTLTPNTAGGTITLVTGAGTVTGLAGDAIATTANTGLTSITTNGLTTATGGAGIDANSTKGTINIQANATVTSKKDAIDATAKLAGDITVSTAAAAPVDGTNNGIVASSGGGNVTVTTLGTVNTKKGNAIDAETNKAGGSGNVLVTASNTVTAGTSGIVAKALGAGNTGTVTVQTKGTVTGSGLWGIVTHSVDGSNTVTANNTVTGAVKGIQASSNTGAVTVNGTGAVTGSSNQGINAFSNGGNVDVEQTNVVTGGTDGIDANTVLAGTVKVVASHNVTGGTAGNGGNGIATSALDGGSEVDVINSGTVVTGVGKGFSGISATSSGAGNILINVAAQTLVVNNTSGTTATAGRAVMIDTSAGSGGAALNNAGTLNGFGSLAYPTVRIVTNNSTSNSVIVTNNGLIRQNDATSASGWAIATTADASSAPPTVSPNIQSVIVDNNSTIEGRVWLGSGPDQFNNNSNGIWHVSGTDKRHGGAANQFGNGSTINNSNFIDIGVTLNSPNPTPIPDQNSFTGFVFTNKALGSLTGTNTINNYGTINSYGNVNFQFIGANSATDINNSGLFRVGSTSGSDESTSFSSGGQQFVTNFNSEFRVIGSGTGTAAIGSGLVANGPSGVGALNFTGADGSTFNNAGGVHQYDSDREHQDRGYAEHCRTDGFDRTELPLYLRVGQLRFLGWSVACRQ